MSRPTPSSEAPRLFPRTRWSLVLAAAQKDSAASTAALESICSSYWQPLYAYVRRCGQSEHDAQDLTQETFIKALQRRGQLKDLEKSTSWLSRIAANTAIDFLRKNKKFTFTEVSDAPDLRSPFGDSPEQMVLRGERKLQLDGGLACLTARERTALLLRDIEDMPADQVAVQMNCSTATVRSHIANARIKFKRYLDGRREQ